MEKKCGRPIKFHYTDWGWEFISSEFRDYCDENGIQNQLTTPYTLKQKGSIERKNRTIIKIVKSMLNEKGLGNDLLVEAVTTVIYLLTYLQPMLYKIGLPLKLGQVWNPQ